MLTVLWGAKGGSGTTVVACTLALVAARSGPTLLIDVGGDVPAALGMPEHDGPGVHDWVASPTADAAVFSNLGVAATEALQVIPRGRVVAEHSHARWADLGQFLAASGQRIIVDAGTGIPPPGVVAAASQRLLVTRACYLALRHAVAANVKPTGVVVVHEPGRALHATDVAHAIHTPVVAEVPADPAVARIVDAGLLTARLPRALSTTLAELLR